MVKVMKKNKKVVAFKAAKIKRSIMRAGRDAKIYPKEVRYIANAISRPVISAMRRRKVVSTAAIRKAVLTKLDRSYKDVAAAWRKYDRRRK